jgi:hypothetical protein
MLQEEGSRLSLPALVKGDKLVPRPHRLSITQLNLESASSENASRQSSITSSQIINSESVHNHSRIKMHSENKSTFVPGEQSLQEQQQRATRGIFNDYHGKEAVGIEQRHSPNLRLRPLTHLS